MERTSSTACPPCSLGGSSSKIVFPVTMALVFYISHFLLMNFDASTAVEKWGNCWHSWLQCFSLKAADLGIIDENVGTYSGTRCWSSFGEFALLEIIFLFTLHPACLWDSQSRMANISVPFLKHKIEKGLYVYTLLYYGQSLFSQPTWHTWENQQKIAPYQVLKIGVLVSLNQLLSLSKQKSELHISSFTKLN